jgi:hypothetical protein
VRPVSRAVRESNPLCVAQVIAESGSIAQRVHFHYVQKGTPYKVGASAFAADCVCDAIGTYFAHLH